jgi:hypothetical protein
MPEFSGFRPEDFDELAGSTWRSRERLGGLLAKALRGQLGRPYQSWAVRRRLELHLALESNYDFDDPWPYAKLFVYSQNRLDFGFYIESDEATSGDIGRFVHWPNFRDRLQADPAMQTALLAAMANYSLIITDYYRPDNGGALGCAFRFNDRQLCRRDPGEPDWRAVSAKDLLRRLAKLPEDQWVDLHVFATLDQETVMTKGPDIVEPILTVLRALVPVYEMTIARQSPLREVS